MRLTSLVVSSVVFMVGCSGKPSEVKPAKVEAPVVVEKPKEVKVAKPMNGTMVTTQVSGGETANANNRRAYEIACAANDAKGCERLAIVYAKGLGVAKNMYKSFELYAKSCELGDGWSCGMAGDMLKSGEGTAKNLALSTQYYKKGCSLNSGLSCNDLGNSYLHGRGIIKDINQALVEFKKAISLGNDAYNNLGFAYESLGDENRAESNYKKGCDLKNKIGCYNLANLYDKNENFSFSYPYYVLACNYGEPDGCNDATMVIFNKKEGVHESEKTMFALASRSCDLGDKTGCANLGYLYKNGMGVAQNMTQSSKYYQKACQLGDKESCGK